MYVRIEIIHDEPQTVVFALEPENFTKFQKIRKISENPQNSRKSAKFQKIHKISENPQSFRLRFTRMFTDGAGAVLKLNDYLFVVFKHKKYKPFKIRVLTQIRVLKLESSNRFGIT